MIRPITVPALPAAILAVMAPAAVSAEPALELDNQVVTANRIAQPAGDVIAPMIVIGRDAIERSNASDVSQLLQFHAGLDIGRNGGPGQATSVFVRGAESNHTLVLIDGVRINPGTIGGAALQNVSPEMVERIEIVKGPRSTLYGTDAIGGVVNIITRHRERDGWIEATAGSGRYSTDSGSIDVGLANDHGWIGVSAGHLQSGGFATLRGNDTDRAHRNTTIRLDAGWQGESVQTLLSHWQADGETEYLGFSFAGPQFAAPLQQSFRNSSSDLTLAATPAQHWHTRIGVARIDDHIRQLDSDDFARTQRTTVDWQNDLTLAHGQTLVAGVQLARENTEAMSFGLGFDESTDINALYLANTLATGKHHLLVAGRYTDHQTFGDHATWNIDYGYDLSDRTRLGAGAGTGFRAPDGTDRFGFGGNPDLDPETSTNVELSFSTRIAARHHVRIGLFENRIDDLVTFDFDPVTFDGINRNLERAAIRGAELGYRHDGTLWQWQADAQIQDPEDRATGQPLARRARRSLSGTIIRVLGDHDAGIEWLASGPRKDSAFSDTINAGYVLANIVGRARLGDTLTLHVRLENVLNTDYETAAGFRSPGRGLYLKLRYSQ